MSIAEKLQTIAENEQRVYESGKQSVIDKNKIIEKTVSGLGMVYANDVSEIKHDLKVKLSSDTITDFSDVKVRMYGNNLFDIGTKDDYETVVTTISITNESITGIIGDPSASKVFKKTKYKSGKYAISMRGDNARILVQCFDSNGNITDAQITTGGTYNSYYQGWFWQPNSVAIIDVPDSVSYWRMGINFTGETGKSYVADNIQITLGGFATDYEPYKEPQIATANADGTVEGFISLSPNTVLMTDTDNVNLSMTYNQSFGMQTEWNRFWDIFQDYGKRTNYENVFRLVCWNDKNFKPKYDLIPTAGSQMFANFGGNAATSEGVSYDIAQLLDDCNVKLDTSNNTNFTNFFYYSNVGRVPEINVTGATTTLTGIFGLCRKLKKIDKFVLKEDGSNAFNNTFQQCTSLTDIIIEGTIGNNFDIKESPLNKASIESVINALSSTITGKTVALNKTAVQNAFGTDYDSSTEWTTLKNSKSNWTITLN